MTHNEPLRVALCQLNIGDDPMKNLAQMEESLAECDADLAVFPEASLVRFGNDLSVCAQPLDGPFVTGLREAARRYGTALIAGVFEPAEDRIHNTAVVIDGEGELAASYRKIHLFDAFTFAESATVAPGTRPVVVEVAGRRIGLVTCYDLRFPELFRALVDQGADMFVVIAAWAPGPFKEDHWLTLARARAIENTMWTVAVGKAPDVEPPLSGGPTGIGRSVVVDPMGTVRRDLGQYPGVQVAEIDDDFTRRVREILPSLGHRRLTVAGEATD
ncbi:MAG TPA: carbon-nitrogen hydrolase family protein [Candidatus Stackebrandtia excrementipullorum]|nr:carbon-nitrogen hydrolase family protein [Candidatus Stackebrandtia excrementipullorum]